MKKVVIWGTGLIAEECIACLDRCICDVIACVETYPTKKQFCDINVLVAEKLIELDYDYLFVASRYLAEIEETIKQCHICLDNVIDWLDFKKYPDNYSTEIWEFLSDDFLKGNLLCKQWDEEGFETCKRMFRNKYEAIIQKECVYVYDLRMHDFKLAVPILMDILVSQGTTENVGILFIPDEKEMDSVWYHNLFYQLERYCFVLWEDMRLFYMGCRKKFRNKFVLDQIGKLLRKPNFSRVFPASRYMDFKYCFEPSKLQQKIDQAEKIDFYWFQSMRIGETIRRVLWQKNRPVSEHTLTVLIPSGYGNVLTLGSNACLTELISREFCMIREESELWFWVKVIFEHSAKCVFHEDFDSTDVFRIEGEIGKTVLDFTKDELQFGKELIEKKFDLFKSEYVCLCVRDSEYITTTMKYSDVTNCYRNYDLNLFMKAVEFLNFMGLKTVRMGQVMRLVGKDSSYIDFPSQGYDEFMDLMFHRHCKYVLGTDSGIAEIGSCMFGKPMAAVWTGYPALNIFANYKSEDLVIFCRFKDVRTKRELSLYETMKKCREWWSEYDAAGTYFEKNELLVVPPDAEEICSMALEMNNRLDGKWIEEDGDQELVDIFDEVVKELYKDIDLERYSNPKVATTFLRRHREEILEMRDQQWNG